MYFAIVKYQVLTNHPAIMICWFKIQQFSIVKYEHFNNMKLKQKTYEILIANHELILIGSMKCYWNHFSTNESFWGFDSYMK